MNATNIVLWSILSLASSPTHLWAQATCDADAGNYKINFQLSEDNAEMLSQSSNTLWFIDDEFDALSGKAESISAQGNILANVLNVGSIETWRVGFEDLPPTVFASKGLGDERDVNFTAVEWKQYLSSKIDNMIAKGINGVFFSQVDNWVGNIAYDQKTSADQMAGLLTSLMKETRIKKTGFKFYVFYSDMIVERLQRNGGLALIDGVVTTDLYTGSSMVSDKEIVADLQSLKAASKKVFVFESVRPVASQKKFLEAAKGHGLYGLVVNEDLDGTVNVNSCSK